MSSRVAPPNLVSLERRIGNLAADSGRPVARIQRAVANTVVGQLLPPEVVKGGTALKLRVGERASRFTPDLDAARDASISLDDYLLQLDDNLSRGWWVHRAGCRSRSTAAGWGTRRICHAAI